MNNMKFSRLVAGEHEMLTEFDKHGRIIKSVIDNKITTTYSYSNKFNRKFVKNGVNIGDRQENFVYELGRKGQILSTSKNGNLTSKFTYNKNGKLIKEENFVLNLVLLYSYDLDGDLIRKEIIDNSADGQKILFEYKYKTIDGSKQLFEVSGEKFEFANGLPTTYRSETLAWNPLKQLDHIGNVCNFKYDSNNNRLLKMLNCDNNNADMVKYVYCDNKLIEQYGEYILKFNYCGNNIIGFTINNKEYFYIKDYNNTIIGIYDSNNMPVCEYQYYSNGNHKAYVFDDNCFVDENLEYEFSNQGLINKCIAEINPFRYKSYYYDIETGLYYYNGKYYDADIGTEICYKS